MAYTVNKTDGSIFAVVADGTLNTDSNVTLVGKNFAGYGEFLNENFVQLLENAANNAAPSSPLTGQLWYDTSAGLLKVFNGSDFKTISAATASNNEPTNNVVGDIWFDTVNNQLNVYNGSDFTLVGPLGAGPGAGETGAIPTTIVDNLSVEHFVVRIVVDDATVAIVSKDAAFTPASAITGFTTTIKPGINLPDSALSGQTLLFQGTATNAQTLDGVDSTGFLSSTGNDTTSGRLTIENNSGLVVGEGNEASLNIAGTDFRIDNRETNGDLVLRVNAAGTQTAGITVDGITADVQIANALLSKFGSLYDGFEQAAIHGHEALDTVDSIIEQVLEGSVNLPKSIDSLTKAYAAFCQRGWEDYDDLNKHLLAVKS